MDEEAAYACAACPFTTKGENELEEHSKTHELGEQCPLCSERAEVLNEHLIQEHKIAEAAVERLLAVHRTDIQPVVGAQFAFRCPSCSLAFKTETAFQQHSLTHIFKNEPACPFCGHADESVDGLLEHMNNEHPAENDEKKLRCDLCAETFTDRKSMLAHLTSVTHLHKAKRHLELGGVDLNAQLQSSLGALGGPPSPQSERKPFRCNVCKMGYGQGATLDIHLRSVAHQSRMTKLSDLISSGEVDPSKPLVEQPGALPQRSIGEMTANASVQRDEEATAAQEDQQKAMAMFSNIINMAQLFQNTNVQPSTSTASDDELNEKSVVVLQKEIEAFGIEEFPERILSLLPRLEELSEDAVGDLVQTSCDSCIRTFSSLLTLKTHYEDRHQMNVPPEILERFVDRLSRAIDNRSRSSPPSRSASRPVSRENSEPPEKRARNDSSSATPAPPNDPQAAHLALLNMMQAGFPFLQPNPFLPMDGFFNPLLAQQMAALQAAASPAKRARTRITDDQLKVLRQYFDINNSPTESQIREMSLKTQLPEKVIKHWFRNTLFKERQRDKDSPYNFSIPPQMGIDLDTYEKTGEAKVVTLNQEPAPARPVLHTTTPAVTLALSPEKTVELKPESRQEPKHETPSPASMASLASALAGAAPPNLATLIGTLQGQNPFSFMQDEKAFGSLLAGAMPGLPQIPQPTAGRRANRTRFTDFQLRTLQQFFDKQAYPKDDDLELLSKKLQLSPRVIVVWFQNARQKARKNYENQPNLESTDRFVRTPGCNYQCKRCNLVFQRYFELIQHQEKKCYKDDGQAQMNDNKGVEGQLTEDEKQQLAAHEHQNQPPQSPALPDPAELLRLLGQGKSSTEALLKMCESARQPATPTTSSGPSSLCTTPPSPFHKRCPFCCLLFRQRQALVDHLMQKHTAQMQRSPIFDVDTLPSADDVPSLSAAFVQSDASRDATPLDLSANGDRNETLSVSPFLGGSEGDDQSDDPFSVFASAAAQQLQQPGAARSPATNKRYRTHLTPLQVHMMKCIFTEYKTPSMAECDNLGRNIGLHKRVVQVWFQNARAKERKNRQQNGQDDDISRPLPTSCGYCGVEYSSRLSLQDHVFSQQHLTLLRSLHKGDPEAEVRATDENGLRNRTPIVRDSPKKATTPLNGNQSFPFNLMNFGLQSGALPMLYDPTVMGTPIPLLQIPESVMQQISNDLQNGCTTTRFTQDGLPFIDLIADLSEDDAKYAAPKNSEVGWACMGCSHVFPQDSLLKAHQRTVCQQAEGCLTLNQTHYECLACGTHFGTQQDFKHHLSSEEHSTAKESLLPAVAVNANTLTSALSF